MKFRRGVLSTVGRRRAGMLWRRLRDYRHDGATPTSSDIDPAARGHAGIDFANPKAKPAVKVEFRRA